MNTPAYGWTPSLEQLRSRRLPAPRGPLSSWLVDRLSGPPGSAVDVPAHEGDAVHGEDGALSLYLLYELHYRGFAEVEDSWEWEPSLLTVRSG